MNINLHNQNDIFSKRLQIKKKNSSANFLKPVFVYIFGIDCYNVNIDILNTSSRGRNNSFRTILLLFPQENF